MKALRKDRTRRYSSVSELSDDICNYLGGSPLIAGPESSLYQIRKWVKRHRALVTFVTTIAATVMIGLFVSVTMYLRAETARQEQAITIRESHAVTDFLTQELLTSVSPEHAQNSEVTLRYLLDSAAQGMEGKFVGNPLAEAQIRETIGLTYQKIGDYSAAESHFRRALEIRRRLQGSEHLSTLNAMNNLGSLYSIQGRHEATGFLLETFELRKRLLGEEHPDTIESMSNLAFQYVCEARFTEGMALATKALDLGRRVLNEEHPFVLKAMCGTAAFYAMTGDPRAESMASKGYDICRRVLGAEHEQTLYFMIVLSWAYLNQGRSEECVALAQNGLAICRRVVGEEHLIAIGLMNHLGAAYLHQDRLALAEPLLTRSVELARELHGVDNSITVYYSRRLADLYHAQRRFQDYDDLSIKLFKIGQGIHGKHHPQLLGIGFDLRQRIKELGALAHQQYTTEDYQGVVESLRTSSEMCALLADKPRLRDMAYHAMALHRLGRDQDALAQLAALRGRYEDGKHAYEARSLHLAEYLFATDNLARRAWQWIETGDLEKAHKIVEELQSDIDRKTFNRPGDQSLMKTLARAYCWQAAKNESEYEYPEAEKCYVRAFEVCPNYAVPLQRLAWFRATCPIKKMRNGDEAIDLATRACELTQWKNGTCIEALAAAYAESGKFPSAVKWQKKAIDVLAPGTYEGLRRVTQERLNLYESGTPFHARIRGTLLAQWDFDQVIGRKVVDTSGNGYHGTLNGQATVTNDQERGSVLCLEGDGYVNCGNDPTLTLTGPITVTAWIKTHTPDKPSYPIICKGANTWGLTVSEQSETVRFRTNGLDIASDHEKGLAGTKEIADNRWHHLGGVYDGTQAILYVDGRQDIATGATGLLKTNNMPLLIGVADQTHPHRFNGSIDDVRIYNYALSESDIRSLYRGQEPVVKK